MADAGKDPNGAQKTVSRRRYEREKAGRLEAERLLEQKSRELFEAHERRVRGGLAANLLGRAIDGNVGFKKPRRVIK